MRKIYILLLAVICLALFVSCKASSKNAYGETTQTAPAKTRDISTGTEASTTEPSTDAGPGEAAVLPPIPADADILKTDDSDLDGDSKPEEITVYQLSSKSDGGGSELEGRIRIKSQSISRDFEYIKKPEGISGIFSGIEYADLDGDGSKDIFVIIPDNGAAFSLNYFFIYSCKKDIQQAYTVDNQLSGFTSGFTFGYAGKGRLEMVNTEYGFKGIIDLTENPNYDPGNEEQNKYYERSWVEPVPVDLGDGSRLSLDTSDSLNPLVKVPLPIFGQAEADVLGEIDVFYRVDEGFKPVMRSFEVYSYKNSEKKLVGKGIITVDN